MINEKINLIRPSKYITSCPKCGDADSLRADGAIDLMVTYNGSRFQYEDCNNVPTVTGHYCFNCGETFTLEEIEKHARKVMEVKKDD